MSVSQWLVICKKNNKLFAPITKDSYVEAYRQMYNSYMSTLNIVDCEYAEIAKDGATIKTGKDIVIWKIEEIKAEPDAHISSDANNKTTIM